MAMFDNSYILDDDYAGQVRVVDDRLMINQNQEDPEENPKLVHSSLRVDTKVSPKNLGISKTFLLTAVNQAKCHKHGPHDELWLELCPESTHGT